MVLFSCYFYVFRQLEEAGIWVWGFSANFFLVVFQIFPEFSGSLVHKVVIVLNQKNLLDT